VNVTSGSQVLYTGASLPAGIGRSLRLLVTGTVKGAASGTIANTALVDSPVGATHTDPDSQNNSATDSDQIVQQADLTVSLAAPTGNVQAGKRVTLTLRVENLGAEQSDWGNGCESITLITGGSHLDLRGHEWIDVQSSKR
jgi:hypothetical protein